MNANTRISPPKTEEELLARTESLIGKTLAYVIHHNTLSKNIHKGAIGQAFEHILGADAGNAAAPDFMSLGIELKTLPIGKNNQAKESTFVTAISLTQIMQETWETSYVYHKLKRVLWIPIEGDTQVPLAERRIGQAFLWSPNSEQLAILRNDWQEFSNIIALGQLETISAKSGTYLQIRPKGADGKSLAWGMNEQGEKIKTLPRGFYLRAGFTTELFNSSNHNLLTITH